MRMNNEEHGIRKVMVSSAVLDDIVSFTGAIEYFCVGLVDIVNSTNITSRLSDEKSGLYYSIFLNTMAAIVKRFGGIVVKNVGDSLLYYFPKTSNSCNKQAFREVIKCGISMIELRDAINGKMYDSNLPELNYRVSVDYGRIMMADSLLSVNKDIFGSSVNICNKINQHAIPNTMVIGGDLYLFLKDEKEYSFKEMQPCSIGHDQSYSVYSVKQKRPVTPEIEHR